ncbi:uncharacterized protein LOC116306897, partial [Actinia tenebrosa]|uniref:Uncharacterized protein LOC116306897 n=1 Tax=Actinia tenebrosa TaxID=6105 RepID=A0A6P8J4G9_ACTTE
MLHDYIKGYFNIISTNNNLDGEDSKRKQSRSLQSVVLVVCRIWCGVVDLFKVVFGSLLLLESVQKAFCTTYTINTNNPPTISNTSSVLISGNIQNKTFKGPNGESWDHEVAVFNIPESNKNIFENGNTVVVTGNNSLSISTTGDLTIRTSLDVSGQEVKDDDTSVFLRGGFVRKSNSCCVLGAGPGAAYSYHGGGHGGRGGGYYQDFNTSRYYSWDYHDVNYLLGGSTSTVLFESKAGSGGGAIEIIAENGTLKIDASISANGFSSKNTSEEHCAGGSSGGLIRLKANTVVFTNDSLLSAKGGNSGFSTSKHYCGDGGGGGVIQVFSTFDNNTIKQLHVHGGKGIDNGEAGVVFQGVFFNDGILNINTSDCSMKWLSILVHQGVLDHRTYRTPNNQMKVTYIVCSFTFKSSLHIGSGARVLIFGTNALKIASERGNIELMTTFDLSGTGKPGPRSLGAFVMKSLNGMNVGPGNVTRCNAINLFANDFETLLGGSVCTGNVAANTQVNAEGGGAIELVAKAGTIVIGSGIKVDGYSDHNEAGATGGLIRLIGKKVHLKDSASFSARSSPKDSNLASGGIVQIKSDMDIEGLCETKFHVTGVRNGLVNVMVSASESYQVQFIQEGNLLINTTLCIWVHRTVSNYSMAYSQFGSIYNDTSNDISTCSFNFTPPIIFNGSANVTLTGDHALSINSKQGIYIGVDLVIDSGMVAGKSRYLGGYCVKEPSLATTGTGPGRGRPNTNAGGGHGGRGGLFFEDNNGKIYGYTYGIKPFLLTGGSTGTSTKSSAGIQGCGGGAIRISSKRNLTINAAIRANGYSATLFNSHPHGGSSGGTICLGAQQVILGDSALLEAKGSDVAGRGNSSTGGGGGGVIVINSTNPFIGKKPVPAESTRGGQGLVPGESGVVIINDVVYREPRNPVVEVPSNFSGCYLIKAVNLLPKKKMLAHEARPKTCLLECRANNTLFAVIRNESCYCFNENASFVVRNTSLCKQPCPATFSYSCGGEANNIYSVYTTGFALPVTTPPPTTTATAATATTAT